MTRLLRATVATAVAVAFHVSYSFAEDRASSAPIVLAQADPGGLSYAETMLARAQALLEGEGDQRNPALAARILTDAASTGSVTAMLLLARLYADGDGVGKDDGRAAELLEDAIAAGNVADAAFALGNLYRDADPPDVDQAVAAYEQAIEAGNSWAMLTLADMLRRGDGVPANPDKAKTLIESAIAAGNVREGALRLGDLYRQADPPDSNKAVAAYERAIVAGNTGAMLELAGMLRRGDGVAADVERARTLIESAIAAGNVRSGALALGDLYRAADPPDLENAIKAYQQAIDAGETWGMLALAEIIQRGEGVTAGFAAAKALIEQAINAGNVQGGAAALGDLYLRSAPPDGDPMKAIEAYQQAVEAGNAGAMLTLAEMLREGDGVPADPGQAKALIEASIAAGNTRSGALALGEFHRQSDPPDLKAAVVAYEQAIGLGNATAMLTLAEMLRLGDGVAADPARARSLIEQAIAAGNINDGAFALGNLRQHADPPDIAGSVVAYEQAIEAGNTQAMLALADVLIEGNGVAANPQRARSLIDTAIARGNVRDGAVALGNLLLGGDTPDTQAAVAAYEQAVAAGNPGAMLTLANILLRGDGVPADPERAKSLIKASIAAGDVGNGSLALGEFHRRSGQLSEAVAAYQQAIDAGNSWAMLALADMVRRGEGAAFDFSRARNLVAAAIEAGNVRDGAAALGDLYRQSEPPDRDLSKAVEAYQQAVDVGHAGAMLTLSEMLLRGDGAPADPTRAKSLIEASIAAGNVGSGAFALGKFYRQADPPDTQRAVAAYEQAIAANNTWAMLAFAEMLRTGNGVAADSERTKSLIEAAIATGNVHDGALALGDFYRLAEPPDVDQALAAYQQAVAAGNATANLVAARLVSARYLDANSLRTMVDHLVAAAKAFAPRAVALDMLQLPTEPLIASVQQLLADNGERVGTPDGYHGARTKGAILDFCERTGVTDCDENFVTVSLIEALLQPPAATQ